MLPYLFLILIPMIGSLMYLKKNNAGSWSLVIGSGERVRESNLMMPFFFFLLFLLLVCRAESVGNDTSNYHYIYDSHAYMQFRDVFSDWRESVFHFLNYFLNLLTDSFQIFLFVVGLIEIVPIARMYAEDRRHSCLKVILFVNMSTFVMLFSGIRQAMAISLGVLAFQSLKADRKVQYCLYALSATLMHTSGFMVFLMYPLYKFRLKKKHLLFVLPAIAVTLLFNRPIFGLLTRLVSTVYDNYETKITNTGAFGSLILFLAFMMFTYVAVDEKKMDNETYALRNFLTFAVVMQCFAPLNTLAMRMGYYFIIFIPLAVGKSMSIPRQKYVQVVKYAELVICVFFSLVFFYSLYIALRSGRGMLNIVPYVPFWKG